MAEILVIKLSAFGDLVQADGALRDIREHHDGDRITVLTTPPFKRFMERCPWIDQVMLDYRPPRYHLPALLRLRKRLRSRRWRRVYDLQQVGRTRFYFRYLFPRLEWVGDAPGCSHFLKRPEGSCAADHFAAHLAHAGIQVRFSRRPSVSWMAEEVDPILAAAGLTPGFVVLVPGASAAHAAKRWPHYRRLAERLLACDCQVVTVPGPDEGELCRTIPGSLLAPPGGYYDYFVLAGILSRAGFVIGNDTGPTHLAAHLGLPGLALFGTDWPPESTGIQYTRFETLSAASLNRLKLQTVWQRVAVQLGLTG